MSFHTPSEVHSVEPQFLGAQLQEDAGSKFLQLLRALCVCWLQLICIHAPVQLKSSLDYNTITEKAVCFSLNNFDLQKVESLEAEAVTGGPPAFFSVFLPELAR